MHDWQGWIGREEYREDRLDAGRVTRWCATLDRDPPTGGTAPQGLHWCLDLPDTPSAALGADGHPVRNDAPGSLLPPIPLPRRMWASGSVEFHAPLPVGVAIVRTSLIAKITARAGSNGPLVFVDLVHRICHGTTLALTETQTLVYREAAPAGAAPTPLPLGPGQFDAAAWTAVRTINPDPILLFRYSALSFNSHRIHYDRPYATGVEGYRGLVVHGPLLASLLLDLARRQLGENRLATFRFRALSPAIAGETLHLALRVADDRTLVFGVFADDGRQIMDASGNW